MLEGKKPIIAGWRLNTTKKSGKGGKEACVELMDKLKGKKVHEVWKKGLLSWEEYSNVVRDSRDATRPRSSWN